MAVGLLRVAQLGSMSDFSFIDTRCLLAFKATDDQHSYRGATAPHRESKLMIVSELTLHVIQGCSGFLSGTASLTIRFSCKSP